MNNGTGNSITVRRYSGNDTDAWNGFVRTSRNGTFLHNRGYMDYHADRFADHSLMFYAGKELIAIMPAHVKENSLCSHNGLTYGGLLLSDNTTTETVLAIFAALKEYLLNNGIATRIIYRPVPHIYHSYPCEEDIYALFRNGALLTECKASSVIELNNPIPFKGRRKLTVAMKSRLHIKEQEDYTAFWEILGDRLKSRYGTSPVHTHEEIELLHERFPDNIRLFTVNDNDGNILGGTVLYVTDRVVHMQYSGTTEEGRRTSALDHLYEYLIKDLFAGKRFFDFGISVEDRGRYLNSGLIAYKERLGGRTVTYNTYVIDLKTTDR